MKRLSLGIVLIIVSATIMLGLAVRARAFLLQFAPATLVSTNNVPLLANTSIPILTR